MVILVRAGLAETKTQAGSSTMDNGYEQRNTGVFLSAMQQFDSITLEAAARNDDNSNFGNHATWQTSAAWEFIDGYRIIGSYGTAYKAPTMSQIHSEKYGNPDLKPEESKQWEGGFEGLTGPVNWRVTGYRNDIDNLIGYDANYRYYNVDEARIKGIEATAQFDTGPVGHQISYDYVDPRNTKTNEVLARRSKQQVKYQLDWQVWDLDWNVSYRYLGTRYDVAVDPNTYSTERVKWVVSACGMSQFRILSPHTSQFVVK